jgi:hypothetical protein
MSDSDSSKPLHQGPVRGVVDEQSYGQSCAAINPDLHFMDRVLDGAEGILVADPEAGEFVGHYVGDGFEGPLRAYVTTYQEVAPYFLVIYYVDDGDRIHRLHVEVGDDDSEAA